MDVHEAIRTRRAYRSLEPAAVTDGLVRDLAEAARVAPSCFNNQPWRFVFAKDPDVLTELHGALSKGNEWATAASVIIGVASRLDLDCSIVGREYFLFDTGLATAFLVLRATELGLVAHPIAGFSESAAKRALGVPDDMRLIALVIVGKHADGIGALLTEKQAADEAKRPERLPLEEIAFVDRYGS